MAKSEHWYKNKIKVDGCFILFPIRNLLNTQTYRVKIFVLGRHRVENNLNLHYSIGFEIDNFVSVTVIYNIWRWLLRRCGGLMVMTLDL